MFRWVCFPPPIVTITWTWHPTTCCGSTPLMESVCPPLSSPRSPWWVSPAGNKTRTVAFHQILNPFCHPVSCHVKTFYFPIQEPLLTSAARSPSVPREPVSRMHLVFEEEDDEGDKCSEGGKDPQPSTDTRAGSSRGPQQPSGNPALQDSGWDAGGTSRM